MSANEFLYKIQFTQKKKISFLTQLHNLVGAGVPAPDALMHMRDAFKKKRNEIMLIIAQRMAMNAEEGKRIADGMEKFFSHEICKILSTSEERGILDEGIKNAIDFLGSGTKFFSPLGKTVGGIVYILASLCAVAYIGHKLLPEIGSFVPRDQWPMVSLSLNSFANALYYGYPIIIAVIIFSIIWTRRSIKNYNKKIYQFTAIPFMRTYCSISSYKLLQTLALLSKNGVGVPEIINILCKQSTSGMIAEKYRIMHERVRQGMQNMGDVMDTGLFTPEEISELHLISRYVGEENFSRIFHVMSKITAKRVIDKMKITANIIATACLFLTGGMILWLYTSYAFLSMAISN